MIWFSDLLICTLCTSLTYGNMEYECKNLGFIYVSNMDKYMYKLYINAENCFLSFWWLTRWHYYQDETANVGYCNASKVLKYNGIFPSNLILREKSFRWNKFIEKSSPKMIHPPSELMHYGVHVCPVWDCKVENSKNIMFTSRLLSLNNSFYALTCTVTSVIWNRVLAPFSAELTFTL